MRTLRRTDFALGGSCCEAFPYGESGNDGIGYNLASQTRIQTATEKLDRVRHTEGNFVLKHLFSSKSLKNSFRRMFQHNKSLTHTSITDQEESYKKLCRLASIDENVFTTFRRSRPLRRSMEHVTEAYAKTLLEFIKVEYPQLLDYFAKFRSSEQFGSPYLSDFGPYGQFSPTTMRYIFHLGELQELLGTSSDNLNIIEIGGGYGGQCKVIHDYFQVRTYTLVDLIDPLKLAKKFLSQFPLDNIQYLSMADLPQEATYDLVISNYAFTECVYDVQNTYIEKILRRSKYGYLKCNFMEEDVGFRRRSKQELLKSIPGSKEIPHRPPYPGCFTWVWTEAIR